MTTMSPVTADAAAPATGDYGLLQQYFTNGNIAAIEQLISRHEADLLRLATAWLNDANAAQDAVQDAYISLIKNVPQLLQAWQTKTGPNSEHVSLLPWLRTVVRNKCHDQGRQRQRRRQRRLMRPNSSLNSMTNPATSTRPR